MNINNENNLPVIFIIDDDEDLNDLIASKISHLNCRIISIIYGKEAISRLNEFQNVLLILDYKLPDISAEELISNISPLNVSFIIMTGYSDIKTAVKLMKLGAKDYLIKDSTFLDLLPTVIERVLKEISMEKRLAQAEIALRESEIRYRTLYNNALVGIISIRISDNRIISLNDFGCKILGYDSQDEINELLCRENNNIFPDTAENLLKELEEKKEVSNRELQIRRKNGSAIWCMVSTKLYPDGDRMEGIFVDITRSKEAEERIHNLTYYDQLTKLPNKDLFKTHIQSEILKTTSRSKKEIFAVICLGIDKFKNINNIYSPEIGNSLLIQVGTRLKNTVFKNDTVSRYESDKFIILFSDIASRDDSGILINKIQSVFSQMFIVDNIQFALSATLGISVYPEDGETAELLIKNSEAAMDMAKERGIRTHFFDADLNAEVVNYYQILNELKDAVINEEFIAYYQPKVNYNGDIVGMESLIRWQSPARGLVFPLQFIPIAEKNGMIVEIGNIILKESCRQNKKWQDNGWKPIKVAVNLSAFQFNQPGLINDIKHILDSTKLDPKWLELEITESGIIENEKESIAKINELHDLGISVSIDDFGTGYSSLSKLKDYPIDTLKIDKFFVDSIPFDKKSVTIAKTIIDLAHNLDFKVVAEGVESKEQLDFLENHNCDYYQGYYFSKPLPPESFINQLYNTTPESNSSAHSHQPPPAG